MKAARYFAPKDVRVVDLDTPDPRPGEVIVKVAYNGICGSDLHAYVDGASTPQSGPHPLSGHQNPTTLGHEFSGTVTALGDGVTTLSVGQNVAIEPIFSCGECEQCSKGQPQYCERGFGPDLSAASLGLSADGGLGEYVAVSARKAHPLPDTLDLDLAALTEPTAVVFQALARSGFTAGNDIAIFGAGPIGLMLGVVARISGAGRIFITDVVEDRLAKARELGFTDVFNTADTNPTEFIRGILPSGVDVAYDCAGVQPTLDAALSVTKNNGTLMAVAIFGQPVTLPLVLLTAKGITLKTALAYANVFPQVIAMIDRNQEQFRPLITHVAALDDVVEEGFERLLSGKSDVKVLVKVG